MGNPPPNAYPPGTVLTVGSHKAMIVKYISEGGFAHVYLVKISPHVKGQEIACLKRVLVPNKATLNILRAEVDAMKRLQGKPCIVSYIDSHAARSSTNDGTYEVFLLMEYCSKNGLIDFLNSRLQNRLTEDEVLQIMYEVTVGLSQVHFLTPPLIHRDIKIENILINDKGQYRLCDFGSSCPPLRPPRNQQEFQILQDDIMRYTTAQYRAPEMIDLSRGLPIDEKSDVWALGVFCYKICYYTTPFEHTGEPAILQSKFEFPSFPVYSPRLKHLITVLLTNDARLRPHIYQVLEEVCRLKNIPVPSDIQKQYLAVKQQKQQQAAKPIQPLQTLQTPPQNTFPLASNLPDQLYNDSHAKSATSFNSTKTGKSVLSGISVASGASFAANNVATKPLTASLTTSHPVQNKGLGLLKNKSSPGLSQKSDPFASLLASSKNSSEVDASSAPKVTPFKPLKEDPPVKPKRPTKKFTNDSLDVEIIDVDMKGLKGAFENSPEQVQQTETKIPTDTTGTKKHNKAFLKKQITSDEGVKRTHSFHKRNFSATKGFSKITNTFTGKFRSTSGGNKASSFDIDNSEDELISEISMGEFKDLDYLRVKPTSTVQKRMQMLLNNQDEVVKVATGYGKYTDTRSPQATPSSDLSKKAASITVPITSKKSTLELPKNGEKKIKPPVKPKKVPPPRPKKPVHLKSPKAKATFEKNGVESKTEEKQENAFFEDDGNYEDELFDVNDFERSFNEKFPKIA